MTKKDYELIASRIQSIISDGALCMDNEDDTRSFARSFADALQGENARFNRDIFARACGFESPEDMDKEREA